MLSRLCTDAGIGGGFGVPSDSSAYEGDSDISKSDSLRSITSYYWLDEMDQCFSRDEKNDQIFIEY